MANSPSVQGQSTFDGLEATQTGVIAIDPTAPISSNQSAFSTRQGLMCTPVAVTQDGNGNFFVADRTAFGQGAGGVIKVNPVSGAESVIAANQSLMAGPAGMVYVNGPQPMIYVICSGTAGFQTQIEGVSPKQKAPDLVVINPNASAADIAAGNNHSQTLVYGPPLPSQNVFKDPRGIATDGGSNLYVVDAGAGTPAIWDFNLTQNPIAPTPILTGTPLLTNPMGIVTDIDRKLIVLNGDGSLVRVDPSTGTQTMYSTTPVAGARSLTVSPVDGTIYVDALDSSSSTTSIWSFPYRQNATTSGMPMTVVPSNLLSLVTGMLVANDGQSLYVATSPARSLTIAQAATLSQDPSAFPTGVVQLTINGTSLGDTVNRTMTRAPGLYCLPQDVAEDSQGNLYVADESALELGAIIKIDSSGQTSLFAWGGDLNGPAGVTVVGNSLYAICTGDSSGVVYRLVQIPMSGNHTPVDVNDFMGLDRPVKVLSGIAPHYIGTTLSASDVLVLDQGGNVGDPGTGQVYLTDFTHDKPSTFGHEFGPGETNTAQADAMAVDPTTGTCYVGTEGNGGGRGAVVLVPQVPLTMDNPPQDTRRTITVNYIYDPRNPNSNTNNSNNLAATDGIAVGPSPNGSTRVFVDTLGQAPITPKVTAVDPNYTNDMGGNAQTRVAESGMLSLVTGLADYVDYNVDSNGNPQLIVTAPADQTVSEGALTPIALGSFSASTQSSSPWQVTVDWGDGSQSSIANVANPGDLGSMTHAYSEERSDPYTVKVAVTNSLNVTRFASFRVAVSDLAVSAAGVNVTGLQPNVPFSQMMATFTDPGGPEAASDYSASISWGDNTTTAGTITGPNSNGQFTVNGSHMYETAGTFTAAVTIAHESAPTTAQTSTVNVSLGTTAPINHVDFETGDLSQTATNLGGAIVSGPETLDGSFSLQLLRNASTAYAEIRHSGTSYYSVANAGYSFLFQYASQVASQAPDSGIVNFQDTASRYMAAIHLSPDGKLVFYDQMGMEGTGTTKLIPNETYLISAKILLNPNPNSGFNWEVDLNGQPEMKGTGSFTQFGQPNGSIILGGNNPYRTNFVYDDVCIQDLGQDPATSTSVTASPTTLVAGQPVTLTATIAPNGPGSPTGIVRFFDNYNTFIGTVGVSTSNGVTTATLTTRILGAGTHTIAAIYGGDGTFTPSFGELTQSVGQASTWVTLSSSANPLASGQPVTFVASVSPYAPGSAGAGYPTGTVTFYDNFNNVSTALGTVSVNTSVGVTSAGITTSTLAAGSHSITARYNGDNNFIACSSKSLILTVAQPVPLVLAPSNQSQAPLNQSPSEGTATSFSLGSFSEAGSGPWTATVSWGDGSAATTFNPSAQGSLGTQAHTYAQEGTYTVTVTVTDTGANTSGSALFTVSVSDWQLVAAPAPISPTTGAPFSGPVATFTDPGGAEALDGTHYSATINWGDGSATSTGSISLSGSTFTVNGTHTYAAVNSSSITVTLIHDGWLYTYVQSSATVTDLGQFVSGGFVKSTSFWEGLQGQGLVRRLGLTSSNQTLGQWLATTFPNLYGGVNGAPNLSIFTNYQVGSYYQSLYLASQGTGLDVEILDTALDLFTTTSSLGGTVGQSYGFTVNSYGLGAYSWNIASSGAAFGTPNNTVLNVFEILLAANNNAVSGEPWGSNTLLRNEALTVFQGINAA